MKNNNGNIIMVIGYVVVIADSYLFWIEDLNFFASMLLMLSGFYAIRKGKALIKESEETEPFAQNHDKSGNAEN